MSKKNPLEAMMERIMSGETPEEGGMIRIGGNNDFNVSIDPEAQIEELRIHLEHYRKQRFAVGDIVTPKAVSGLRGAGIPAIVIETNYGVEPEYTSGDATNTNYGGRFDIRVMTYADNENVRVWWSEAWQYEPYRKAH